MYTVLHPDEQDQLRAQRIYALEREHYATALQLEEAGTDDEARALHGRLSDLERRITLHSEVLHRADVEPARGRQDVPATDEVSEG